MRLNKRKIILFAVTVFMLAAVFITGFTDLFTHGFFCTTPSIEQIGEEGILGYVNLSQQECELEFMPQEEHFSGFGIYFKDLPENSRDTLCVHIYNSSGLLEEISTELSEITSEQWFFLYTDKKMQAGHVYTLKLSLKTDKNGSQTGPCLLVVDPDYLGDENVSGNLLLAYAYAKPTFSDQTKLLINLFIISVWMFVCSRLSASSKCQRGCRYLSVFIFLTAVLSWNYMYNSMDNGNTAFSGFQEDSETLVTGVIEAERRGVWPEGGVGYGLGRYEDASGTLYNYSREFLTDDNWTDGYSKNEPAIILPANSYTRSVAADGNFIGFSNGDVIQMESIEENSSWMTIRLSSDKLLKREKYGDLSEIVFYNADHVPYPKGSLREYKSQFGLQGKVFRYLARYLDKDETVSDLHLFCSIAAAIVFNMIVLLIHWKYNTLFSGCFFVVFWLSPWIVNFAGNLYWVEFTWFVPMAAGLFCSWKLEDCRCRLFSYFAVYISVTVKCLCGYEYISVIMMGMISFLLVDFVSSWSSNHDRMRQKLLLRTIWILGMVSMAGFFSAICIHARLKGSGDILGGIQKIFLEDVLRRTGGADLNHFGQVYWPSINASVWEVFCKYFHFSTEVITGIAGNLFPVLCIAPLTIFLYEYKRKELNFKLAVMYAVFFFTSVSWFVLAKSHSYIHTHMNYVLWYFGFVQTCLYVICSKAARVFRLRK